MKTHFSAICGCLVLFLVPSPRESFRNFLPCSHWKFCCFFLGDFTESHSKVIFFDFTCVWVLFRCLTRISMLNHVPYFSDIGNRVKYQNANSLYVNLVLFIFVSAAIIYRIFSKFVVSLLVFNSNRDVEKSASASATADLYVSSESFSDIAL